MEPVVFEHSPLALYLKGEDDDSSNENTRTNPVPPSSPVRTPSFAPQGFPTRPRKLRRKPPPLLNLEGPPSKGSVARFHHICSRALNARLGWTENSRFLEQFRYTIIASQLLNDVPNAGVHKRHNTCQISDSDRPNADNNDEAVTFSWTGLALTALAAFALAWSVHWTRSFVETTSHRWPLVLTPTVAVLICSFFYLFFRRQWLYWLRDQVSRSASTLVTDARNLDAVVSASINLIQEVELVSRGYRISSQLPPVTRLEERSQTRRCIQVRRALQRVLTSLPESYYRAYEELKPLAVEVDLEKYLDIYEISRSEVAEFELLKDANHFGIGEDTLKAFKFDLQKLYVIRKLFFCSLLAISADGSKLDFAKWSAATRIMDNLSAETRRATEDVNEIFGAEEDISLAATPQLPLTPGRERMRSQMRKLNSLSQGIRGLQARLHILREDADKLGSNSTHQSANTITRYDSIGAELRILLEEWQNGRKVFTSSLEDSNNRLSLPVMPKTAPSSPTMSLGGSTVVEGSPPDALRALNGFGGTCHRATSSTATSSAGEEVFEAIALPRQKSTLSKDERLAKMKEDRIRQAMTKSKNEASSHMLKELETVIKLRPRVLEARLEQAQLLKKVVDAIKDLVQDCNFDCNDSGIALQAMDNSHVALVSMMLKAESFSPFRCDRNIALGINLSSLMKVLRCAQNEDILTLKAQDAPDVVNLQFETSDSDRLSEYDIKLMDIDQEHLGIPETEYAATITMPSSEFQRICRDLMALSESVAIEATKDGVKFSCSGDIGNGAVTLRSHTNVENPEKNVDISLSEPVALTFSLKYLVNFCKASGLSGTVKLCLSNEVPLLVEYTLASNSYLRFYLAPKVVYGRVGNTMAAFVMQTLGCEVAALNTVHYSNHLGYRQYRGTKTSADEISELYVGLKQSYLIDFDIMLTGYAPNAEAVNAIGAIGRDLKLKASTKPGSFFWVLDPVMGDEGRLYVDEDVVPAYKSLLRDADLILPNQFELEWLSDVKINSTSDLTNAITKVHRDHRVPHIVVTSVRFDPSSPVISVVGSTSRADRSPRLFKVDVSAIDCFFSGTGDMFAALAVVRLREAISEAGLFTSKAWQSPDGTNAVDLPLARAVEKVLGSMHTILEKTKMARDGELEKMAGPQGALGKDSEKRLHLRKTKAAEVRLVRNLQDLREPAISHRAQALSNTESWNPARIPQPTIETG
ncbi:MAG: hypothetical protein Q9172_000430 [Xanthocarpia lactea]